MESFFKEANSQFETLEAMFNKMTNQYKDLSEFFAFDLKKYPLGKFFTNLRTFLGQFKQCVKENCRAKEKIRRAEENKEAREKEREAKKEKLTIKHRWEIAEGSAMEKLWKVLQIKPPSPSALRRRKVQPFNRSSNYRKPLKTSFRRSIKIRKTTKSK